MSDGSDGQICVTRLSSGILMTLELERKRLLSTVKASAIHRLIATVVNHQER